MTAEDFIKRSNLIHNNKYDYSLVDYKNNKTKVKIICPTHGVFEQEPESHLKGHGCKKCGIKRLSKDSFILKSNEIHNNFYDYSLVEYKNSNSKVKIICPIHGVFEQRVSDHLNGHGCFKCGLNVKIDNLYSFIMESNLIHDNKYDYSLVNYKNNKLKVKIICPIHGVFEQRVSDHLNGHGCPNCRLDKLKITKENFIKRSNEIHNNFYDYSLVKYKNSNSKVKIICPIHGVFEQRLSGHLQGFGCIKCNQSKGEKEIEKYLINNKIKFESQKKFKNCKNIRNLSFDFYLKEKNICIEYDGEFHSRIIFSQKEFEKQQVRDSIKNEYCLNNNIKLLRISFNEFKNINEILERNI